MDKYLESITLRLPDVDPRFTKGLNAFLVGLRRCQDHVLEFTPSQPEFFPRVRLDFQADSKDVLAEFRLSDGKVIPIKIENSTGMQRKSPHTYQLVNLSEIIRRLTAADIQLVGIDHVGFNLPWFSDGVHPDFLGLRKELAAKCLYHRFPSGEPWDFILPGDREEIDAKKTVDYDIIRKPKFELVSFEKSSTPLIQIDLGVNCNYDIFKPLFPEALDDPDFKNIWIYLENPYPLDVCLVINEFSHKDWSPFFKGSRL